MLGLEGYEALTAAIGAGKSIAQSSLFSSFVSSVQNAWSRPSVVATYATPLRFCHVP